MDEAASRLRMELDSMPTEMDQMERQIMQLEIEQARSEEGEGRGLARTAEKDSSRTWRNFKEKANRLKAQWQNEKAAINAVEHPQQPNRAG